MRVNQVLNFFNVIDVEKYPYVCIDKKTGEDFVPTTIHYDACMVYRQVGQSSDSGVWYNFDDVKFIANPHFKSPVKKYKLSNKERFESSIINLLPKYKGIVVSDVIAYNREHVAIFYTGASMGTIGSNVVINKVLHVYCKGLGEYFSIYAVVKHNGEGLRPINLLYTPERHSFFVIPNLLDVVEYFLDEVNTMELLHEKVINSQSIYSCPVCENVIDGICSCI